MHLLVIHDEKAIVHDFQHLISQRLENIEIHAVLWRQLKNDVDLIKCIETVQPDCVLFLAMMEVNASQEDSHDFSDLLDRLSIQLLAKHTPLIFLSSAAVFSGEQLNYDESCDTLPSTHIGRYYQQLEMRLQSTLPQLLILRSSWIYSPLGSNFLTQVIHHASKQKIISVNSAGKGCPTASVDLARVLVAICLQIDLDIDVWGVYHYASSDASIGFQFIETLLSQAAQFDNKIDAKNVLFEHNDAEKALFFFEPVVLKCQKLLDTFGIHQKPWRSMIADRVKDYYLDQ